MAVSNKQVVRRFIDECWNSHDAEKMRALCDPNVVTEESAAPEPVKGIENNVRLMQQYLSAFPDIRMKVLTQIEEGDRVVTHFTGSGTHKGPFLGVPATQRKFSDVQAMEIDQVRDGKIVHSVTIWDVAGMTRQLGISSELAASSYRPAEHRPSM